MSEPIEEEIIAEEEAEMGPAAIARLREKLATCVKEKQEYLEGWQRSRADFANLKKEESANQTYKEERIKAQFAEAILPALDAAWFAQKGEWFAAAPEQLQTGVRHISSELGRSLEGFGMTLITGVPPDEKLDFAKFEIIREVSTDDEKKDQTVEEVFRPGLAIGDHVIRPAQVSVCVYKKAG